MKTMFRRSSLADRAALGGLLLALSVTAGCASSPALLRGNLAGPGALDLALRAETEVDSALGDYLAGNFALDHGDLAAAATYFERALSEAPDNLELRRQVFLLTLASGRYDLAMAQADQLGELGPEDEDVHLLRALTAVKAGDFAAARTPLEAIDQGGIAALARPFLDAWAIFGEVGAARLDEARARLDDAETLGPLNTYHAAMLLDLGGRPAAAETLLQEIVPDGGPAPVRVVQAYAHVLARQGKADAARQLLQGQLEQRSEQPVLLAVDQALAAGALPAPPFADAAGGMADALLGIAEALRQEAGSARAVLYARLALYVQPDLAEASLLIGDIMNEQGNHAAAVETYRAVPAASAMRYAAELRTANALHDLERDQEAYDLLDRIAEREPARTEALVQLGNLLRTEEDYERAEAAYSRAIARLGEPQADDWTLYYARGITYERTQRWDAAEADFLKALELQPEQPFVLNYLGYSWVDMGRHLDRAKEMLVRAVELRPNDGFIVDSLGWVYYRLGDYEDAVERLERAVELEPGDPVINDHLGDAYWKVGRQREARFQWRRALSLDPEEEAVADIEKKLRSGLARNERDNS